MSGPIDLLGSRKVRKEKEGGREGGRGFVYVKEEQAS